MFVKLLILVAFAVVVWSVAARPSVAHGERVVYRVQSHDTLWSIAASHYGGDVRSAIWRIQRANGLRNPTVHVGERLVLP